MNKQFFFVSINGAWFHICAEPEDIAHLFRILGQARSVEVKQRSGRTSRVSLGSLIALSACNQTPPDEEGA